MRSDEPFHGDGWMSLSDRLPRSRSRLWNASRAALVTRYSRPLNWYACKRPRRIHARTVTGERPKNSATSATVISRSTSFPDVANQARTHSTGNEIEASPGIPSIMR